MYVCVCGIGKIPFAQLVRKTRLSTRASSRKMPMRDWNKDEMALSHIYTKEYRVTHFNDMSSTLPAKSDGKLLIHGCCFRSLNAVA